MISKSLAYTLLAGALLVLAGALWQVADSAPFFTHQMREGDTTNLVLNFNQERDQTPWYAPRVHQRGMGSGVTGSEFPLLYWLASFAIDPLGHYYFPLRLLSVAFLLLSALAFGGILHLYCTSFATALTGGVLLMLNPLLLFYGFKVMPDLYFMGLGLSATYLGLRALRENHLGFAIAASLLLAFSASIKPFGIVFAAPVFWEVVNTMIPSWRGKGLHPTILSQPSYLTAAVLGLLPVMLMFGWFRYTAQVAESSGGGFIRVTPDFDQQLRALVDLEFWRLFFTRYLTEMILSYGGTLIVVCITPLLLLRRVTIDRRPWFRMSLFWTFAAGLLVVIFGVSALRTAHEYYGMILVPPLLSLCLWLLSQLPHALPTNSARWTTTVLVLLCAIGSVLRVEGRFRPSPLNYRKLQDEVAASVPLRQRVLVFDKNPTITLNAINRHGLAVVPGTADSEILQLMSAGYWPVCPMESKVTCTELQSRQANRIERVAEGDYAVVLRLKEN